MISRPSPAVHQGTATEISAVHPDILQTHIFTRLDGPTLASVACTSSHLHVLSSDDTLWREICNHTWPSTSDPRIRQVISFFPSGHHSFYSDSFPTLHSSTSERGSRPLPSELISVVDLHYEQRLIISKVQHTETKSAWFMSSPFRVDLLDPKESVQTGITSDAFLDKNLTLSWIMVDPTRSRAANFASLHPVSVTRHWLTGDLHVRFAIVISSVQCAVVVTCGGEEGGELNVKEVSFVVENMEGRSLDGEESLVILQDAMENGKRRKRGDGELEEKARYEECLKMKKEAMEKKERKERRMDMVCVSTVVTLVTIWYFFLFKIST